MYYSSFLGYVNFFKRLLTHLRGEGKVFSAAVFLSIFSALAEVVGFGLLIPIVESAQAFRGLEDVPLLGSFSKLFSNYPQDEKLIWAAGILLLLTLVKGVLAYLAEVSSYSIPSRVEARLRMRVYNALHKASISYVESFSAGDLTNITSSGPARIGLMMRFAQLIFSNSVIVFLNLLFMAIISPGLTAGMVFVLIVLTLIYKRITSSALSSAGKVLTQATADFGQVFFNTLNGMRFVRLSGDTSRAQDEVSSVVDEMRAAHLKRLSIEATVFPFFATSVGVLFCTVLLLAALWGTGDNATVLVTLVATIYLMSRLLGPITLLNVARVNISANIAALDEMDGFFQRLPGQIEKDGSIPFQGLRKVIQFSDVGFYYPGHSRLALKEFNFSIAKGEKIGLVGLSGSGKSTVISLLVRIYRPSTGTIFVDGVDLDNIQIGTWWSRTAVVMQDVFLKRASIRDNLTQGLECVPSDEVIWKALHVADAANFVRSKETGLDQLLGDRGGSLSGGEKQRLSLARALLRDPDVLILDEATSNLDVQAEATIVQRISQFYPNLTMLVVAHRIGAIRYCDRVVVLRDGAVVHEALPSAEYEENYPSLLEVLSVEGK